MDQGLNLSQNIDTLFNNIEKYTKTEGVIGKPVTHEDKTFIPVVSVSVGCGGGNTATKMPQGNTSGNQQMSSSNMAGGALGLGAKINTDAIIVIDKGNVSMMTLSAAGNASQLLDKIPEMVKGMTNQQQSKQS
ncbi:MAG TPA: spore germination protein GerW family protein [Clostridium sp.]|uniref:GerW family sporulation protein n=1 Tax=Clostridium sp. TaxID=1506 RepID=UPI002F948711